MLPPGHIAGGFLTAEALLKIAKPNLPAAQLNQLLWWGMFFGFSPDLDAFYVFIRDKAWIFKNPETNNHRQYVSHTPAVWMLAGLVIILFAPALYWKYVGAMLWLGSWTHFLLDSIEYGIMWLWPFSRERYCLKELAVADIEKKNFFPFWMEFVKSYIKQISFYLEILIIIIALVFYISSNFQP